MTSDPLQKRSPYVAGGVPVTTVVLAAVLICLVTALAYAPVFTAEFVHLDDNIAVVDNQHIQSGLTLQGIRWAFTSTYFSSWQPLTWISYMMNVSLSGLNAPAFHITNLALHLINTVLLLLLLIRMTGYFRRSVAVTLLFALHPLHVESVAWISERKDLLSALFFMLTLHAYREYTDKPSIARYLAVLAAYMLGLCSKPMLVTVPFLLLLLDYWPLGRLGPQSCTAQTPGRVLFQRVLVEKIPLLVLAAGSSIITVLAQRQGGGVVFGTSSLWDNMANALTGYVKYLYMTVFPVNLAVFYPFENNLPLWQPVAAGVLLASASLLFLVLKDARPYLITGWLFYLVMLLPVIGIIRAGGHAIADRYTYLPLIGPFISAVWSVSEINGIRKHAKVCLAGGACVVVLMACLTWAQSGYWRDSNTLFRHAAQVTDNNWLAYINIGADLIERRNFSEASYYIQEAIRLNPYSAEAYLHLGTLYNNYGDQGNALHSYQKSLELNPDLADARFRMGLTLVTIGDTVNAYNEYRILQDQNPKLADVLLNAITVTDQMLRHGGTGTGGGSVPVK